MRFEGTHIPGQHTTVVPVPQQIILPERKIIGPAEAEKWHASRGSGVAADEGGGTPILRPGLIGWALTGGPEQTLSSAGVIASGPEDLSLALNSVSPVTYNSDGANFTNPSQFQVLKHAPGSEFQIGSGNWEACCILKTGGQDGHVIAKDGDAIEWYFALFSNAPYFTANNDSEWIFTSAITENVATFVRFGVDADAQEYFMQVNTGSVVTAPYTIAPVVQPSVYFTIGGYLVSNNPEDPRGEYDGDIKMVLIWKDQPIKSLTDAAWLANMSGGASLGRTPAEIAAYTG